MSAIWTPRRPEMAESLIRVAAPVSSRTWQGAAFLANFLRGKGAELVPWCVPQRSITAGTTESFRFRVKTRSSAVQRVWGVILRAGAASGVTAEIEAPALTGTTRTVPVSASLDTRTAVVYIETLGSKAASEVEISVSIKAVGGTVIVEGIACMEQDRPLLNQDTTDYGVDVVTLSTGQPMLDDAFRSLGGVMDTLANADARRVGLFHWTLGDGAATRTAASYTALLTLAVPMLARKLARAAVTGSVKWSAWAKVAAGAGGQVRLTTTSSGVSDVMTVTSTSYAWTTARSISIDCDDMESDDGRQTAASPAWDDLQLEIQGDGTNLLSVGSVSIWADD
jgi:hypothetical protein